MLSSPSANNSGGTYFSRFLDTVGDGSGTKDANGDFSGAAQDFLITPNNSQYFSIHRLIVEITDAGPIDAGRYGNNIILTNGITLLLLEGATIITDFTDGMPVFTNATWAKFCYDVLNTDFGAGDNYVQAHWTFTRGGAPLRLPSGRSLALRLNDDFTGLISHTFLVQGLSYD